MLHGPFNMCMFGKYSIAETQYRDCEEVGITKKEAVVKYDAGQTDY